MNNNIRDQNLTNHLWEGHIPLWKTFWIFGVLGNIIAALMIVSVEGHPVLIQSPFIQTVWMPMAVKCTILLNFVMIVAIYRSADNYQGNEIWAVSANIMVGIGLFSWVFSLPAVLKQLVLAILL